MTTTNQTKRQAIIETEVNEVGNLLIKFPTIDEHFVVDPMGLRRAIIDAAILHGLKQKLVDAAAISRNMETGRAATARDKYEAVKEVFDRITSPEGTWNAIREGGGGAGNLLLKALFRYYQEKQPMEALKAKLEEYSDEQKAALKRNPKIAAIIVELQAEKADKTIDTDELLSELGE